MDEFIVWVKEQKKFYELIGFTRGDNLVKPLVKISPHKSLLLHEECEIFPYIRKTDINGKKIYADCSIIEFEHLMGKYYGTVEYQCSGARYLIKVINLGEYLPFNEMVDNIEIIDTIQENKKGLIRNKPCPKCQDKGYITVPGNHDISCEHCN